MFERQPNTLPIREALIRRARILARRLFRRAYFAAMAADTKLFQYDRGVRERHFVPPIWIEPGTKVCVYAHNDPHGIIDDIVLFQLSELARYGYKIILVSTSRRLSQDSIDKAAPYCLTIILRTGLGRDIRSYRYGFEKIQNPDNAACILFMNDSIYGPLYPMDRLIQFCEEGPYDLTGATESYEGHRHVQSYFLHCKNSVVRSPGFKAFVRSLQAYRLKMYGAYFYEPGWTVTLQKMGFKVGALVPYDAVTELWLRHYETVQAHNDESMRRPDSDTSQILDVLLSEAEVRQVMGGLVLQKKLNVAERQVLWRYAGDYAWTIGEAIRIGQPMNPTAYFWSEIIELGFPFIKAEMLRLNPAFLGDTGTWVQYVHPEYKHVIEKIKSNARRTAMIPLSILPSARFPWISPTSD
jgi:hypothetical protein